MLIIFLAGCGDEETAKIRLQDGSVSLKDFFRNPEKSTVKISPDGNYLSYLAPYKTRLNIFVRKIGSDSAYRVTSETDRDILLYIWAGSNRILYLKDNMGDENYKLYSVKADGGTVTTLIDLEKVNTIILDDELYEGNEVLILLNKRNPAIYDVFRINIETGKLKLVYQNPGTFQKFLSDHNGKIRLAFGAEGPNSALYYRRDESQPFKKILSISYNDIFIPIMFTPDNKKIIAASNIWMDKQAIIELDPVDLSTIKTLYSNQDYDVSSLIYSRKTKSILAFQFTSWKREYYISNPNFGEILKKLYSALGDYEISIADIDTNEVKYIIRTYSDRSMGAYYLFDKSNGRLDLICEVSPWLDENRMSKTEPVQFRSRDSLLINGYLTVPNGTEPKNLPTIVKIHGGPWARDTWGFDPEAQFLASRGFAVFQVNYRGSVGYGKKFWQASFRQWGMKMADDITDGVKWLIVKGIADKNRIAVYGASYGGYQALMQLIKNPDMYRCGISYVGLTNLFTFMRSLPPSWTVAREKLYRMIGNPELDSVQFYETSPVFHASKIKVPVFIAQGANDFRVKQSEAEQMVAALKKNNIKVEYMLKKDEGHGFAKEENRMEFYKAMELFLEKYMAK